jgi:hypothetical protein
VLPATGSPPLVSRAVDKRLRVCLASNRRASAGMLDAVNWHYLIGDDDF